MRDEIRWHIIGSNIERGERRDMHGQA
jgi:hypothetical protein